MSEQQGNDQDQTLRDLIRTLAANQASLASSQRGGNQPPLSQLDSRPSHPDGAWLLPQALRPPTQQQQPTIAATAFQLAGGVPNQLTSNPSIASARTYATANNLSILNQLQQSQIRGQLQQSIHSNHLQRLREAAAASLALDRHVFQQSQQQLIARSIDRIDYNSLAMFPRPNAAGRVPPVQQPSIPEPRSTLAEQNTAPFDPSTERAEDSKEGDGAHDTGRIEPSREKRRRLSYSPSQREEKTSTELDRKPSVKPNQRESKSQAEQWEELYQDLCSYRQVHGNCLVPQHTAENVRLARWVKRQRYQYKLTNEKKASNMTPDRVKKLEDIGFVWDSHNAIWEERLEELKSFKREHGHTNVPITFKQNKKLAAWVKCQRRQYTILMDGDSSNMTPERVADLERLGFEWQLRPRKQL